MRPVAHLRVLDGLRGASILFVLASHLLPLGPKAWQLNHASGVMGMALFFCLSGFLITSFLLKEMSIPEFLMRRFFRIVPLAWLYVSLALFIWSVSFDTWAAHFLFYANLPPQRLVPLTEHMWSVCVEVQFYVGVAILVGMCGARGLYVLPILFLLFTMVRVYYGVHYSSVTYFRFDEILAGCTLALAYHGWLGVRIPELVRRVPQLPLLLLLLSSCTKQGEWLNYFRPYLGAIFVGALILNPRGVLAKILCHRVLAYCASISYALYVIHPLLAASWLGSGDVLEKYAKRPLLFAALFVLAHLSTYHYERKWTALGRRLADSFRPAPR